MTLLKVINKNKNAHWGRIYLKVCPLICKYIYILFPFLLLASVGNNFLLIKANPSVCLDVGPCSILRILVSHPSLYLQIFPELLTLVLKHGQVSSMSICSPNNKTSILSHFLTHSLTHTLTKMMKIASDRTCQTNLMVK